MSKPEIIIVALSNGDVALFVNTVAIHTLDASEEGTNPRDIGERLAEAMGCEMKYEEMDEPSDPDWNWNDVFELLPAMKESAPAPI